MVALLFLIPRHRHSDVIYEYMTNLTKELHLTRFKATIDVKFVKELQGHAGFCDYDRDLKTVAIELTKGYYVVQDDEKRFLREPFMNQMYTLGHEMVHAKQFLRGELSPCGRLYKGQPTEDLDYYDRPEEQEAILLEKGLFLDCFPWNMQFRNHP